MRSSTVIVTLCTYPPAMSLLRFPLPQEAVPVSLAIEALGLTKSYGDVHALAGIDFERRGRAPCSACSARTAPARRPPSGS